MTALVVRSVPVAAAAPRRTTTSTTWNDRDEPTWLDKL